ncbi:MAG: hypothetical protein ACN0LA_02480 [Candidatus Longimicrobiales bacterium M2_2A_002]
MRSRPECAGAIRALPLRTVLVLAAVLAALATASTASAQEIAGVALGPDGEPLVGAAVVLHRVGTGGGAVAGRDTTGPNGEFSFPLATSDSSVYFAAVRYQERLYVGPAAEGGGEPVTGYVLQVGPESEIGAVGAALGGAAGPPPARARPSRATRQTDSDTGALLLVALLAVSAAAAFIFTAPRYRRRRTREAVIEVAGIENRLADPGEALDAEERERLEARRDQLKEQLAPGA